MKLLNRYHLAALMLFSLNIACQNENSKPPKDAAIITFKSYSIAFKPVSIITLIANPEKYDRQRVRVIGFLTLGFESNGLYLHKEDFDRSITKNGIWVSMSTDSMGLPEIKKCSKQYVLIEGTFNARNNGHLDAWSGSIENIKRLMIKLPPKQYPVERPRK